MHINRIKLDWIRVLGGRGGEGIIVWNRMGKKAYESY